MTPDAFKDDWYGELTNQCGHTLIGVVLTALVVSVWCAVSGEPPYKLVAFGLVFLPYALIVEWLMQDWLEGDSWFDTAMVAFGSIGVLAPLNWSEDHSALDFDPVAFIVVVSGWAVLLTFRVLKRFRRG